LLLWLLCVTAIVVVPRWQVIPLDVLWTSLALLFGYRLWPSRSTLALIGVALVTTAGAFGADALRHMRLDESLEQVPLLALMFAAMTWKANRRVTARSNAEIAAATERLLAAQREFLLLVTAAENPGSTPRGSADAEVIAAEVLRLRIALDALGANAIRDTGVHDEQASLLSALSHASKVNLRLAAALDDEAADGIVPGLLGGR
jgi:hypothetical protein